MGERRHRFRCGGGEGPGSGGVADGLVEREPGGDFSAWLPQNASPARGVDRVTTSASWWCASCRA
ncbi:MAG: hypothetical protein R2710_14725 [Acidimicrobiales bacterium]